MKRLQYAFTFQMPTLSPNLLMSMLILVFMITLFNQSALAKERPTLEIIALENIQKGLSVALKYTDCSTLIKNEKHYKKNFNGSKVIFNNLLFSKNKPLTKEFNKRLEDAGKLLEKNQKLYQQALKDCAKKAKAKAEKNLVSTGNDPASKPQCTSSAQCDDGNFCNGAEFCIAGSCQPGLSPCEAGEVCIDRNCTSKRRTAIQFDLDPETDGGLSMGGRIRLREDLCQYKAPAGPDDPYFKKKKSSWGIQRIGFTSDKKSAWNIEDGSSHPVIVAVIDTGLDWNHKDFSKHNLWTNPGEIPRNGKDDDGNGFIDDIIGWNFVANNNKPWDDDGHGTFVAGIIAAKANNSIGIAGINQGAKIMVLKALNGFGQTRSSLVAEAIFYAASHGAKVINVSVAGKGMTQVQQDAINYAHKMGAIVVMAAGNEAMDTATYSSGLHHVIAVASTDAKNKRAGFSNWGQHVDIAAPGKGIVSLRARRTDLMASVPGLKYKIGQNYVGKDKRYFRANGTSFSAPMVSATASLIWAKYPDLSNTQVTNMLLNSAQDIEAPGWDNLTGYGLLDASAALQADPDYFTVAKIRKVAISKQSGNMAIEVYGSANSSDFKDAWLELGFGKKPKKWQKVGKMIDKGIKHGRLTSFPVSGHITKKGIWTVRLLVSTNNHGKLEARDKLHIK